MMETHPETNEARRIARGYVGRFTIVLVLAIVVVQFTQSARVADLFMYMVLLPGIGFTLLSLHPVLGRIWHALFGAGAILVSMQILTTRQVPEWLHLIGIALMALGLLTWFRQRLPTQHDSNLP